MADKCGPNDQACLESGLNAPIAVGARISPSISMGISGSATPEIRLMSARPDVLSAIDDSLVARSAGVSAVLISTKDGVVLDFIHVWTAVANRISLEMLGPDHSKLGELTDTLELMVGESVFVTPAIYGGVQRLAGSAETEWELDQNVASIHRDGAPGRRRLVARSPGRTTVRVRTLGLESTIDLVVTQ
jgi:hypothetical protein